MNDTRAIIEAAIRATNEAPARTVYKGGPSPDSSAAENYVTVDFNGAIGFEDEADYKKFWSELKALVRKHTEQGYDWDLRGTVGTYDGDGDLVGSRTTIQ